MTLHLFGNILTPQAIAHNNRGENRGSLSTLQKVIRNGDLYSTVSSEAIRHAIREAWQENHETVCRRVTHHGSTWDKAGKEFTNWEKFIDNDVLGYMHAKKETRSRRGVLEISRSMSTTPWPGTVSAQFASPGSNPAVAADHPIPYQCEIHDTRYQYAFAFTPDALEKDKMSRTKKTLLAIQNLRRPAGNHARFLFDFSPDAIVLRWTADPAPRIMFCFEQFEDGRLSLAKLIARVRGGDIEPAELAVGTAEPIDGLEELRSLKVSVYDGVKKAFSDILARVGQTIRDGRGG